VEEAKNYLMLFADLVGSTDVAVEASPSSYSRQYVASFHHAARRAYTFVAAKKPAFKGHVFAKVIERPHLAGDEVRSFSVMPGRGTHRDDIVGSAVAFAYAIKLLWLASPYNLGRILNKQFPRDLSVGIHIGPAVEVPCPRGENQVASLHINLAKRIETAAKEGKESRIFASYEVRDHFHAWTRRQHTKGETKHKPPLLFTKFEIRDNPDQVKGIPKPLTLFELEWDREKKAEFDEIVDEGYKSPRTPDADIEGATKMLMEMFIPPKKKPFSAGRYREVEAEYASTSKYISGWFNGIESVSRLFFDEPWLVISSYWLSCGLLRHSDVVDGGLSQKRYMKIAKIARERLRDLWEDDEDTR
jgi:class 3 adenylate cyclase